MEDNGTPDIVAEFGQLVGDAPHRNIHDINQLQADVKDRVYALLIPGPVFESFGIDRDAFTNRDGHRVVDIRAPSKSTFAVIGACAASETSFAAANTCSYDTCRSSPGSILLPARRLILRFAMSTL